MEKLIDKTAVEIQTIPGKSVIRDVKSLDVKALSLASQTPANVLSRGLGSLPIGYYRGGLAFIDLDKMVNQPLVDAESQYILGVLDGRLEGYDLVTVTLPLGSAVATSLRGRLTVPAGQVWFITAIVMTSPKDATSSLEQNWRCSLWTDQAATPDADGQAYHATDLTDAANTAVTTTDLFGLAPVASTGLLNKPRALRLPGGSVLTFQFTIGTAAATAAVANTAQLYGFVGKALVA